MRNSIACKSCSTLNPQYKLNCSSCNSILRNRVVNIDFWLTVWGLIDSPVHAYLKIIHSEHKNYLFFISILAGLNFWLDSLLLKNVLSVEYSSGNILISLAVSLFAIFFYMVLLSIISKYIFRLLKSETRIKDNLSIYFYALIPQLVLFPILFIIEFAIFGKYWLSFNPSPFILKPTIAYVLAGLEGILFFGSLILTTIAVYAQTKLKLFSILFAVVLNAGIIYLMIIL